ncbi:MAG: hypothetical protein H6729_05610 [Deltaproteobacteria bacterium]|nr:hypothetical protein [Deltaproteobacteria bacterium]
MTSAQRPVGEPHSMLRLVRDLGRTLATGLFTAIEASILLAGSMGVAFATGPGELPEYPQTEFARPELCSLARTRSENPASLDQVRWLSRCVTLLAHDLEMNTAIDSRVLDAPDTPESLGEARSDSISAWRARTMETLHNSFIHYFAMLPPADQVRYILAAKQNTLGETSYQPAALYDQVQPNVLEEVARLLGKPLDDAIPPPTGTSTPAAASTTSSASKETITIYFRGLPDPVPKGMQFVFNGEASPATPEFKIPAELLADGRIARIVFVEPGCAPTTVLVTAKSPATMLQTRTERRR